MSRAISRIAVVSGRKGAGVRDDRPDDSVQDAASPVGSSGEEGGPVPDMAGMESILGAVDENDPRSIGRAMRKLAETSGESMDGEMEEVVRRLESGEDPEAIEDKMGDAFGGAPGAGGGDDLYDG